MWKIALPYKPGEKVFIATSNHLGEWSVERWSVSHYLIKSEEDVSIALCTAERFSFRFLKPFEVFSTEVDAIRYMKQQQEKFKNKI